LAFGQTNRKSTSAPGQNPGSFFCVRAKANLTADERGLTDLEKAKQIVLIVRHHQDMGKRAQEFFAQMAQRKTA